MIQLNYRDARPINEQVRDELRHLIVTGALPSGEKMPSVRALATQLAINPNTIQRAYAQLEQEGYLYSVSGKGSFVSAGKEQNDLRKKEVLEKLLPQLRELKNLGLTTQELLELWEGGDSYAANEEGR